MYQSPYASYRLPALLLNRLVQQLSYSAYIFNESDLSKFFTHKFKYFVLNIIRHCLALLNAWVYHGVIETK